MNQIQMTFNKYLTNLTTQSNCQSPKMHHPILFTLNQHLTKYIILLVPYTKFQVHIVRNSIKILDQARRWRQGLDLGQALNSARCVSSKLDPLMHHSIKESRSAIRGYGLEGGVGGLGTGAAS
jgi:hypothetical protein